MRSEKDMNQLRSEVLQMVADELTPVALRYGYSEVPLEINVKWRPLVLVLGNYSSGKSTLINEFLGADIQATGQTATDDSFTVITYDDSGSAGDTVHVTEERDGKVLLNGPEYPFETLKRHGQRFASHFRLKKVNSSFLKNLAVIDTPGMLDSITKRERGYDYQEVIGDLAEIADLVLVLFDPHKAGTVREAHISIRDTLPSHTFEERVLFVLNRIDECGSLIDLLRVYGTLCWNLSQITGRKDIPMIHLTYSPHARTGLSERWELDPSYLRYLENQRESLKNAILQAPRYRLDHLATFVETHGERLSHFLEALISYRRGLRTFRIKYALTGFLGSMLCGGVAACVMMKTDLLANVDKSVLSGCGGLIALSLLVIWMTLFMQYFAVRFHRIRMKDLDRLTRLENQTRRDSWEAVCGLVRGYLKRTAGQFSLKDVKKEYAAVRRVRDKGSRDIREALQHISSLKKEKPRSSDSGPCVDANNPESGHLTNDGAR
ncbi:MAG: dynamin family protein [Deltaproteobacteria bacterium]|jgi:GTPase SAR1 family protein|nr:dynamin family protein [Deltaproteobacteria bacterium]